MAPSIGGQRSEVRGQRSHHDPLLHQHRLIALINASGSSAEPSLPGDLNIVDNQITGATRGGVIIGNHKIPYSCRDCKRKVVCGISCGIHDHRPSLRAKIDIHNGPDICGCNASCRNGHGISSCRHCIKSLLYLSLRTKKPIDRWPGLQVSEVPPNNISGHKCRHIC